MDKISDEIRFKVIEMLLKGHTRRPIESQLGVSAGYISPIKKSLTLLI